MDRYFLITVWVISSMVNSYGQSKKSEPDSLVKFNEIEFTSPAEKEAFLSSFVPGEITYFNLALFANAENSVQATKQFYTKYTELTRKIETGKFNDLKTDKKIKVIYDKVQDELLIKYSTEARFDQLFIDGTYNCVTATMLYGIILTRYSIPFDIKETTQHVFLVAKSENKSLQIESTDPNQGYISYNQSFKEQFIEYLKKNKLISASDLMNQRIDSIFNQFYFPNSTITLQQLGGIQYFNNALTLIQDNKNKEGFLQLQKSYYLYPAEKTKYLIQNTLFALLNSATYLEEADWKYFVCISRLKDDNITTEVMSNEFLRITQKILIDKSNSDLYTRAYNFIYEALTDSALKASVCFNYNFHTARFYLMTNQTNKAFPYIEQSYKLKPDNFEVQNIFITSLLSKMDEGETDSTVIKSLENYYTNFESLRRDPRIVSILAGAYIYQAEELFHFEKWVEGDVFLAKFEAMLEKNSINNYFYSEIETVYTQVAAHYFKINNLKKSREYINRGLKYYPQSYRLKSSLEMLK